MDLIFENYIFLAVAVLLYMTAWFLISVTKKRNDVADVAWGLGFLLVAIISFARNGVNIDRGLFVTLLVFIWAVRLSYHIYTRNRGKTEDYRYKKWREEWGKLFFIRSYLQVFILQGFLLLLIVSPVVIVNITRGGSFGIFDFVGFIVWLIGFYFESVGDAQLSKFIKNPENKDKVLDYGLWKYTRHPNYFGEVTQWWGIFLIALSVPFGVFGVIGPLTITFLILKVSGIPMLEKKMVENPKYTEYIRKTSVFFPLPPKR
jgi:steroid 5-alpha reductase family enzyme